MKGLNVREWTRVQPVCTVCKRVANVRLMVRDLAAFNEQTFVCHFCKLAKTNDNNINWLKGKE
jgi:hypothetical protein